MPSLARAVTYIVVCSLFSACKDKEPPTTSAPVPSGSQASAAQVAPGPTPVREPPYTVSVVASGQDQAKGILIADSFAYWRTDNLDTEKGDIRRVPLAGGKVETVVADQKNLVAFYVANGSVFWSNDDEGRRGIYTKKLAGGAAVRLVPRENYANAIYASDQGVFWLETAAIYRVALSGGAPTKVFAHPPDSKGMSEVMKGDGAGLFTQLDDAIFTLRTDGSSLKKLATIGWAARSGLAADATSIFVALPDNRGNRRNGKVLRLDRATGAQTVLLPDVSPTPWDVAVEGAQLYLITNGAGGSVLKLSTDGRSSFVVASNIKDGSGVAVKDGVVFWTAASGTVSRAAR